MIPPADPTPVYFLRRGTLYGAALGLLLGLANVTIAGMAHLQAIYYWRNWIGGGALVGLTVGAVKALALWRENQERSRPN